MSRRGATPEGAEPLPPFKKWRAITLATLLLVPGYWSMLVGLVVGATKNPSIDINPGAAIALGLAIIPFVFMVLAFLSEHPRAPGAILKAMGLSLLVGIPVSAFAGDAVTGIVAGVGAGGTVALRSELTYSQKSRALAVLLVSVYTFVLVRAAGPIALLPAPILPFTSIGIADHLSERKAEREMSEQQL